MNAGGTVRERLARMSMLIPKALPLPAAGPPLAPGTAPDTCAPVPPRSRDAREPLDALDASPPPRLPVARAPAPPGVHHSPVSAATVLSFPQAKLAAAKLGDELSALRAQLPPSDQDPPSFDAVAEALFGAANAAAPPMPDNAVRVVSNWGKAAAYPQIVIDPSSGGLFIHASDRSDKWFGPYVPEKGARLVGSFGAEQRAELASIVASRSGGA